MGGDFWCQHAVDLSSLFQYLKNEMIVHIHDEVQKGLVLVILLK